MMSIKQDALLSARNLEIGYGEAPVLHDLSLDIAAGSFIGLIGPNGAGKTTLALALSGQFRPQKGQIQYHGQDIYLHNLNYKRVIGYVHESPFFYPHLSAEEFLFFVARIKRVPASDLKMQIAAILDAVKLADERGKLTAHLSQGMRKKLAIAAALLGAPKILFLDEALNGVDIESAFHIKQYLQNYTHSGGTVILSTHVLEVIEKICDRYIILKNGRIVEDVTAENFKTNASAKNGHDLERYVIQKLQE